MDSSQWIPKNGQLPPPPPQAYTYSTATFRRPPLDGLSSICEIVDWHLTHSPEYPVFEFLGDDGIVTSLKWRDVAPAMHRAGWLVRSVLEQHWSSLNKRYVVGIIANTDTITYATTYAAVHRSGNIVFPISPRNSAVAIAHLLRKTHVDHVLLGDEPSVQILAFAAFECLKGSNVDAPSSSLMPSFETLYPVDAIAVAELPPIQYELDDLATVMHSPGSTAFPKPIHTSFGSLLYLGRSPFWGGRDMTGWRIAVHAIPMYHGMGLAQLSWAALVGTVMTCYKPQSPPRVPQPDDMLCEAHVLKSDLAFCVPSFAEEWAKYPRHVEMLKQMKGLLYGGGPMDKATGDYLYAHGVDIFTMYGCSEYGIINDVLPKAGIKDWEYFTFSPICKAHVVPEEDASGIGRLLLLASEHRYPSVVNASVNGVPAFDTNDLLSPHPILPGYWKLYGRADDQIMHSNGEKTNPGPLENILNQDPHVNVSIIFGRGRFNAGALIDPRPEHRFDPTDEQKLIEFRNKIWPTVEKMNEYAPQHSRLFKEMIFVASPKKPFTFTAKNTPRRHAIINEYEAEINALYELVEETTQADLSPPSSWNLLESKHFVRLVVSRVLDHEIDDSRDFFQNGCDSLQATWIRNSLLHALRETTQVDTRRVPINFIYNNPTISALAQYMASLAKTQTSSGADADGSAGIQAMYDMLEKYSRDFPAHTGGDEQLGNDIILVTGTTGGLGAALLAHLVEMPEVERVYAVNRKGKTSLSERQGAVLVHRGYPADDIMKSHKVRFVETEVGDDILGLSPDLYDEIRQNVTHIIHNGWPVNFNMALSTFEPSIKGVRNLIDLALSSPHSTPPRIIFLSSEGVLHNIDHTKPIKEEFVEAKVAAGTGYSESKWVSEQLLALASRRTPLPSISLRAGQITGSDNGVWNTQEWLPSLIKSSIYLGCIPLVPGDISWIPANQLARAVIEARNTPSELSPLHLAHPRPVSWNSVIEPLSRIYGLQPVPYGMWFTRLRQSAEWGNQQRTIVSSGHGNKRQPTAPSSSISAAETSAMLTANPALKLLSFFTSCNDAILSSQEEGRSAVEALGLVQLDVTKARTIAAKRALSEEKLKQIGEEDLSKWVAYWESVGFLPQRTRR